VSGATHRTTGIYCDGAETYSHVRADPRPAPGILAVARVDLDGVRGGPVPDDGVRPGNDGGVRGSDLPPAQRRSRGCGLPDRAGELSDSLSRRRVARTLRGVRDEGRLGTVGRAATVEVGGLYVFEMWDWCCSGTRWWRSYCR